MAFLLELGGLFEGISVAMEEGVKAVVMAEGAIKIVKGVVKEGVGVIDDVGKVAASVIPAFTSLFETPKSNSIPLSKKPSTRANDSIHRTKRTAEQANLPEAKSLNTHELFNSPLHTTDSKRHKTNPFHTGSEHKLPEHRDGLRVGYSSFTDESTARTTMNQLPLRIGTFL